MALTEQMKEAIQADIADESSKKERIAKQVEGLKSTGKFIGETAVESVPGVSEGIAVRNVSRDLGEGDYVGAGIETLAGLAGLAPAGGDVLAKGLRKFNKTRKAYKVAVQAEDKKLYPLFVNADKELPVGQWIEADFPDIAFTAPNGKVYVPTKGAKRTKGEKTKGTGDQVKIPDEETAKKLKDAGFSVSKPTKNAPHGTVVSVAARPGLHASQSPVATHLGPEDLIVTDSEKKKLLNAGVTPEAFKSKTFFYDENNKIVGKNKRKKLSEAELSKLNSKKVNYVKRRAEDQVFVEVDMADDVDYQSMLLKEGKSDINDFVPKGGSYKYSDGQADSDQWVVGGDMKINRVLSREEARAIQKEMGVTDLPYRDEVESILGRKFAEGGMVMDDYLVAKTMDQTQDFAKGGMPKQMELFEPVTRGFNEGGLMDEGGSVDPESGNDVPVGSTQEEVRDDIPAQLSEGEFVLPADVVRFHGLEKIMALRDEAKAGLAKMEAMGQMGNSEEAVLDDDVPFSMEDLDMEDDGVLEYSQGGAVKAQVGAFIPPQQQQTSNAGVFYTPPTAQGQTGVAPTPTVAASSQYQAPSAYTAPTQASTPTQTQSIPNITQFMQQTKPARVETIVNTETGEERQINFIPGVTEIPEGFVLKANYTPKVTDVGAESKTVDTTRVQEQGEDDPKPDDGLGAGGGRIGWGGSLDPEKKGLKKGSTQVGVSFKNLSKGFLGIPSLTGMGASGLSLATGKPLPEDAIATVTYKNVSIDLPAAKYNKLKEDGFMGEEADVILESLEKKSRVNVAMKEVAKKQATLEKARKTAERIKTAEAKAAQEKAEREAVQAAANAYYASTGSDESGNQYTAETYAEEVGTIGPDDYTTSTGYGVGAKGGLFKKDTMTFHNQMEKSGLTPKK